jgi:predicted ester cyclase
MRKLTLICIMAVLCSGFAYAQKDKTKANPQNPQNKGLEEKNKQTARRVFDDLWTNGRYELISSMYEPNAIVHMGNESVPLSQAVADGKEWRSAFPDLVMRANQITSDGNMVNVRFSGHGTNKGQGKGLPGKGKPGKVEGTSRFKFDNDGKIAEVWVNWNESDLRRQVSSK